MSGPILPETVPVPVPVPVPETVPVPATLPTPSGPAASVGTGATLACTGSTTATSLYVDVPMTYVAWDAASWPQWTTVCHYVYETAIPATYTVYTGWVSGSIQARPTRWHAVGSAYTGVLPTAEAGRAERAACEWQEQVWQTWSEAYWCDAYGHALTEEQIRERARRQRAEEEARAQATLRAKDLFLRHLTPEQERQFTESHAITVEAAASGRRYRVHTSHHGGRHGNIEELDDRGVVVASLCCAPSGDIPHFDAVLGQLFGLQFDEERFRDAANFTPRRRAA